MKGEKVSSRVRSDPDVEAIDRGRKAFFKAFNATDLDGFMAWLTDDMVFMDHGGPPPLIGKEAIRSSYKSFFERVTPNLTSTSDEIVVSGDWAFDRGTWISIKSDKRGIPQQRLASCYVMQWRRPPEGGWKLARSIWNGADVPLKTREMARIRRKPKEERRK